MPVVNQRTLAQPWPADMLRRLANSGRLQTHAHEDQACRRLPTARLIVTIGFIAIVSIDDPWTLLRQTAAYVMLRRRRR